MTPDCPLCRADGRMLEHLSGDWRLCNCCGRTFRMNDDGMILAYFLAKDAPTRPKPLLVDVSGNLIDGP